MALFRELHNVIGRAVENGAYPFQGQQSDIAALFERVKGFIVHAAFQQPVLADSLFFHGRPQGRIIQHGCTNFP